MNWKQFWQDYPERSNNLDLFQQVGKTVHGQAISEEKFDQLISGIKEKLALSSEDKCLDLCCGNGLITKELAPFVSDIVGVDFSVPLIKAAVDSNELENVRYMAHDINFIHELEDELGGEFTKVLCYEALAFFYDDDLDALLRKLRQMTEDDAVVFIASVLDYECRFNFYNTIFRKIQWVWHDLFGKDPGLGHWWKMSSIQDLARKNGFSCEVIVQDESLHTAHYRKDILLKKI